MSRRSLERSTKLRIQNRIEEIESEMKAYIKTITNNPRKIKSIQEVIHFYIINSSPHITKIKRATNKYLYHKISAKDILVASHKDKKNIHPLALEEFSVVQDILDKLQNHENIFSGSYIINIMSCMKALIDIDTLNLLLAKRIHTMKHIRNEAKRHKLSQLLY